MQSHFSLGASTVGPTHLKWNHSIGQPGISQAVMLPDSEPPQGHQNSFPAVATVITGLLSGRPLFSWSSSFYYEHQLVVASSQNQYVLPTFQRLQYSKGCALQVLRRLSIVLAVTAFFVSLNQILRSILPMSANIWMAETTTCNRSTLPRTSVPVIFNHSQISLIPRDGDI